MEHYGILSLIPVTVVIIAALITRRTLESLLFGAVVGFVILSGTGFFAELIEAVYRVMMHPTIVWIILVCGLFGSLVVLLEKSGGVLGFSEVATKIAKGRKSSLIITWILGIIVFADDYLNALAVGVAMRKVTDKYKISREFLAYVINSTGATVCVLVPFSTWSAVMIGQMEMSGAAEVGKGTVAYIHTLPYILYAWVAIIIVPLYILNVIPTFGPMRKAEKRAAEGQPLPHSSTALQLEESVDETNFTDKKPKASNFIIPILVLAVVTVWSSDMLTGVIIALACCVILYAPQRLMKPAEFCDAVMEGFKSMIPVLALIVAAWTMLEANNALGLTPYAIETVTPLLNPIWLPVITFIVSSMLNFFTGSFWGIPAIIFPIMIPISQALGVDLLVTSGAIIASAAFGSQSCFYGDAATMTCASTQIQNIDYARNVLPLIIIPFVLGCVAFIILGFIMA